MYLMFPKFLIFLIFTELFVLSILCYQRPIFPQVPMVFCSQGPVLLESQSREVCVWRVSQGFSFLWAYVPNAILYHNPMFPNPSIGLSVYYVPMILFVQCSIFKGSLVFLGLYVPGPCVSTVDLYFSNLQCFQFSDLMLLQSYPPGTQCSNSLMCTWDQGLSI